MAGGKSDGKPEAGGLKASNVTPLRPRRPCPVCGRTSQRDKWPFCSTRCADADLGAWLGGAYAIPARAGDEEETRSDTGERSE